jgi:hypothetical protein
MGKHEQSEGFVHSAKSSIAIRTRTFDHCHFDTLHAMIRVEPMALTSRTDAAGRIDISTASAPAESPLMLRESAT